MWASAHQRIMRVLKLNAQYQILLSDSQFADQWNQTLCAPQFMRARHVTFAATDNTYVLSYLTLRTYMALVCNLKSLQQIDLAESDYNSNSAAGCAHAPQCIHSTTTCSSVYQLLIGPENISSGSKKFFYHASNQRTSLHILLFLNLSAVRSRCSSTSWEEGGLRCVHL